MEEKKLMNEKNEEIKEFVKKIVIDTIKGLEHEKQNEEEKKKTSKKPKTHPLPVIKIRDAIIKCDLETKKCYIEAPADTQIDVAGNEEYEVMFDGKAAWLEPRKKIDNKNEKK